jgi:RHS repeat-associated protein
VASVVAAWGTPIAATTATNYDNLGEVTSVTAPGGAVSRYGYDVLGRSVSATAAYGTSLARTTTTAYDTLGRTIAVTDPANKTTTTAYDDIARSVAVTDPLNKTWSTAYDPAGRPTTRTDPLGKSTITAYDLLGRVTSVTDQLSHATTYKYTVNGDRDTVTDPNTNLTQTAYDQFGRTIQVVDPLSHSTNYAYDRASRVTVISDALGRQRQFGYDGLGRKTSESWYTLTPDGLVFVQTQTFGYDAAGNLSSATDPDGNYTITSDALNRPVTVTEPLGLSLTFGYDDASNRNSVTDNRGGVQTSTFNLLNQLTSRTLHTSTADARVDYSYTPRGQLDTASRFTNLAGTTSAGTSVYGHDDAGHVTGITHHIGSGAVIADYSYTYDDAGRLHTKTENGTTSNFGYDDAGQLTQDGAAAHSYDATGNRTDTGYTTTNGNRLQSDGTWTYTYDDAGELIKKSKGANAETWTYQYDHRGQLVVAEQRDTDGGTLLARVEYAYDAFGNRLRRTEWNGTGPGTIVSDERFAYDGWDTAKPPAVGSENFDAWADLDASGNITTRRLFGAGVDNLVARLSAAGAVAWYGTDLQGSVRLVFDNSGVYGLRDYSGFGAISAQSGAGLDRYGYTGREWDSTLGVQYSRARIYDPVTGRFLTADPMGFAAGDVNLYRYVRNRATNAMDPSGLAPLSKAAAVAQAQKLLRQAEEAEKNGGKIPPIVDAFSRVASDPDDLIDRISDALIAQADLDDHKKGMDQSLEYRRSQPEREKRQREYDQAFGPGAAAREEAARAARERASEDQFWGFVGGMYKTGEAIAIAAWPPAALIFAGLDAIVGDYKGARDALAEGAVSYGIQKLVGLLGKALSAGSELPANSLTAAERAEIQAIADKYETTIDIVGSRAEGRGRMIEKTHLPQGKDPVDAPGTTRSDIDFKIDGSHPQVDALIEDLRKVSNNAGTADKQWSYCKKATYPPYIRFSPKKPIEYGPPPK